MKVYERLCCETRLCISHRLHGNRDFQNCWSCYAQARPEAVRPLRGCGLERRSRSLFFLILGYCGFVHPSHGTGRRLSCTPPKKPYSSGCISSIDFSEIFWPVFTEGISSLYLLTSFWKEGFLVYICWPVWKEGYLVYICWPVFTEGFLECICRPVWKEDF